MRTEEIVRSLRWCGTGTEEGCSDCSFELQCDEDAVGCVGGLCDAAADKIEELVDRCARYAEEVAVLRQTNEDLRDTVLRRDAQIEKMSAELTDARNKIKIFYNGYDQLDASNSRLMAANEKLAADRKALINELCQYCGKYKKAHEGACDGCRWKQ